MIAQFNYLNDCQVKIPVLLREQDGHYFMKNPVRPNPSWQLDLIIRSIDFPENHPLKLMKSPFGETEMWESNVIKKVGHSDFAEIYEITIPSYFQVDSGRKSPRVFCLAPVRCFLGDSKTPKRAICVDVSDTGFGLRFEEPINLNIGENCHISFDHPLSSFPEIGGKIVRQSTSVLDRSTTAGVLLAPESKAHMSQIIEFLILRQNQQNSDSYIANGSSFDVVDSKVNLMETGRNLSKDLFSMFSGKPNSNNNA
ncbi:MAG: PilZ domain-containing protein [Candidatus Caenarcaniphilales bacterium]|nr:PilZ domain-containing protein [Candidatus Caenarcaniphilales bacterium]